MSRPLRIGTRASALAQAQARWAAAALGAIWTAGPVTLVSVTTAGDRLSAADPAGPVPPSRGWFVGALQEALLAGEVDVCVHSAKDLPPEIPDGLSLAAFPARGDPRDALVAPGVSGLADLPPGAVVATGSPRRAVQLRALRPDLTVGPVRGNVDTRLHRVAEGAFAGAVLALAGLTRLGRAAAAVEVFAPDRMVPAAGQGALALEVRHADAEVTAAVRRLDDPATAFAVLAERAVLAALGGGCQAPAGALTTLEEPGRAVLRAAICGARSGRVVRALVGMPLWHRWPDRAALCGSAAELAALAVEALRGEGAQALLAEGGVGAQDGGAGSGFGVAGGARGRPGEG